MDFCSRQLRALRVDARENISNLLICPIPNDLDRKFVVAELLGVFLNLVVNVREGRIARVTQSKGAVEESIKRYPGKLVSSNISCRFNVTRKLLQIHEDEWHFLFQLNQQRLEFIA